MSYSLFLDDERDPPADGCKWIVVRSYAEAASVVQHNGLMSHASFDHDLGDGPTGYDFVKWLVNYCIDNRVDFPTGFSFYVHSQNPVGKQNIESYLRAFLEQP